MKLSYIDIHTHLNFPDFDSDRDEVIKEMQREEIGAINVGTSLKTSGEVVELAGKYDHLWATVGIHPHEADKENDLVALEELAHQPKVVAIGECGLDYFRLEDDSIKEKQKALFVGQIEIAKRLNLPLMLHIRDSYDDVLAILDKYPEVRVHGHFFSGSSEVAQWFFARGGTISFPGVITFTDAYDKIIKQAPKETLMTETDAPYVAPAPYRGQRNSPLYIPIILKKLAEKRGISEAEAKLLALDNAKRVFGLEK